MKVSKIKTLIPAPESLFHLELSNDNSLVNCNYDGTPLMGAIYETSEISIHYGGIDVWSDFTVTLQAVGISSTLDGRVIRPSAITADTATITVTATHRTRADVVLHKVYTIGKNRPGIPGQTPVSYSLISSLKVVRKNNKGQLLDTQITFSVNKVAGTELTELGTYRAIKGEGLDIKIGSRWIIDDDPDDESAPVTLQTSGYWGDNDNAKVIRLEDYNDTDVVYDTEEIGVVRYGDDAILYYITSTVKSIDADEHGTPADETKSITLTQWKKVGKDPATVSSELTMRIYTVLHGVRTQYGQANWGSQATFTAAVAKGKNSIDAVLLDNSGNEVGQGFSIAVNWQGKTGASGATFYTWIRYADSITFDSEGNATGGSGMSDSPKDSNGNFKEYIGFAYNKTTPNEGNSYGQYKWTKFKGTDGENGIQGEPGVDGQSFYTWIKYADSVGSNGYPSSMYDTPKASTEYIGIAVNKTTQAESNIPSDYTWSKFKGDQGVQGPQGPAGVTYYTWIRYADRIVFDDNGNATSGSGMSDSPIDANGDFRQYIGFAYNKTTPTESNSYSQYKWTLFKGTDGVDGIDGEDGADGQSLFTWIKYADAINALGYPSTSADMYDTPKSTTEYIGIAVNKTSRNESTNPQDYTWSKFKGDQGVQGPQGPAGVTYYTWIRYADSITFDAQGRATGGTGMSDSPIDNNGDFKEYIGFAYNKTTSTESNSYTEYKWTKFKGTDGVDGIDGEDGADGKSLYTWIKYADSINALGYPNSASDMYDTPKSTTQYIGIAVNKTTSAEGTNPQSYTWSKFKGDQGVQGPKGDPGTAFYTWIRYADRIVFDANGNATSGSGMSDSPIDENGDFRQYIGFAYNKTTATESNNYSDYKWTQFKGTDGVDGIDGADGADGRTLYTWIKYADSIGYYGYPSSMYDTPKSSTEYIGIAVNKTTQTESSTPSDYTWSKFKGDQGVQGPQGEPGTTYYTWIRFADSITFDSYGNATGGTGMSDSPIDGNGNFKEYIGFAYNKTSPYESDSYTQYKWTKFKGTDGTNGINGEPGVDGVSFYTWIKYADSVGSNGYPSSMYDSPKSTTEYIGIAVNQTTATEGSNPSSYTWSKFKGDQGVAGPTGPTGPEGPSGKSADYIFARGTGKNNDEYRVVNICSSENKVNSYRWKRGLVVLTVDRTTLQINEIADFDTYALVDGSDQGETERARMVSYLQTLDSTVFVVITSKDACRWDSSLISELQNFGMGDLPYPDNTMSRTPFAMLGYRGLPKGLALMRQYSDAANEPYAEVSAYIVNGNFMSSMDGKNGIAGQNGKFYYYDGVFTSGIEYVATAHQAPYVAVYDSGSKGYYFYMLIAETNLVDGTYISPTNPNNTVWEPMGAKQKYFMSEVVFADKATLGSAVFCGDYMISQYGEIHDHDGSKVSSQAYQQFDATDFLSTEKMDEEDSDPTFNSNSYVVASVGWLTLAKGKMYTLSAEWNQDYNLDGDGGSVNIILTTLNSSTPLQAKEELTSSSTSAVSITVSESTPYAKKHFVAPDNYNCYVRGCTVGVNEGYELGVLKCRVKRRVFVPKFFVDLLKGYAGMTEISDWARIPGKAIRKTVRLKGSTSKVNPADEDVIVVPATITNLRTDREVWIGNPVEQPGRTIEVYNYGKGGVFVKSVMPPGISSVFMTPHSSGTDGWTLNMGTDYVYASAYSGSTFIGTTLEYARLWSNGQYWYVLEWRLKEVS